MNYYQRLKRQETLPSKPKTRKRKKIYERQEGTKAPERETSFGLEAKVWECWNSSEKWIWNWEFGSQMRTVSQTRKWEIE